MTNFEKYKYKLPNITIENQVAIVDGKIVLCDDIDCDNCEFNKTSSLILSNG